MRRGATKNLFKILALRGGGGGGGGGRGYYGKRVTRMEEADVTEKPGEGGLAASERGGRAELWPGLNRLGLCGVELWAG